LYFLQFFFTWMTGLSISLWKLRGSFPLSTGTAEPGPASAAMTERPITTAAANVNDLRMDIP
jgi:hypothetical protein